MIINYGSCIVCIAKADANLYILTVNPTPAAATVTLNAPGFVQFGNQIQVRSGTTVQCEVYDPNYIPFYQQITVVSTQTLDVALQTGVPLTINTTPADAIIYVTIGQHMFELPENTNVVYVPSGQEVSVFVTAVGYAPKTRAVSITEPTTISVELEPGITVDLADYNYEFSDEGDAKLIEYKGTDTDITVP